MRVDTTPGQPDCVFLTRDELEYALADFYASGFVEGKPEDQYALKAVQIRNELHRTDHATFYQTLRTILERSKEL